MESILRDLRFGIRALRKRPGFTLVAVLTLAIGIGANSAIFSVVDAVILRPLPFTDPHRLAAIGLEDRDDRAAIDSVSYPDFLDWRAQQKSFARMAAYYDRNFTFQGEEGAVRLRGAVVSSDLFPILGVQPILGRTFLPEEDRGDGGRAVVLTHSLWANRFAADPAVVGQGLSINGEVFTVVGVMPPDFRFPIQGEPVDLWANIAMESDPALGHPRSEQRGNHFLDVVGRLAPGATVEQARTELNAINTVLQQQYPDDNDGDSVKVETLATQLTGDARQPLMLLFAAVAGVLLIACANVSMLMLVRAAGRRRDIAVRSALGAGRWAIVRQLLVESLLLALAGGVAGVLLAAFATDALIAITPSEIPRLGEVGLDARAVLFTFGVATVTGILIGLVPALQTSRVDVQGVLKEGGRGTTGGTHARVRNTFVIVEVALALVLLVTAGLLINSFARLSQIDSGFDPERLLTLRIGFPDGAFSEPEQIADLHGRLYTALETLPGVSSYATVAPVPMSGSNYVIGFSVEGRANPSGKRYPYDTRFFLVGADYFRTVGIPFRDGRDYDARDARGATPVVIVNESFAERYFPNEDPIGKRIDPSIGGGDGPPPMRQIVGVVADARSRTLGDEPVPEIYLYIPQVPALGSMTLFVRTEADPEGMISAVRQEIARLDSRVPVSDITTFDRYVLDTVARPRFNSLVMGIFGGVALLLTAIGLFGVVANTVSQRTHEIGVRMALGAQQRDVRRLVVRQGMLLVLAGVAIGLVAAVALTRVLESLLFGVSATDPATFAAIVALLAGVALVACYLPARRAARIDPTIALRSE